MRVTPPPTSFGISGANIERCSLQTAKERWYSFWCDSNFLIRFCFLSSIIEFSTNAIVWAESNFSEWEILKSLKKATWESLIKWVKVNLNWPWQIIMICLTYDLHMGILQDIWDVQRIRLFLSIWYQKTLEIMTMFSKFQSILHYHWLKNDKIKLNFYERLKLYTTLKTLLTELNTQIKA